MYVLTELGYVLISQVKEKEKKCSFENALVEKSESFNSNVYLHGFVSFYYCYYCCFFIMILLRLIFFILSILAH